MLTYNQIIALNKQFADAHKQLKNFGNGADFDMVLHSQENPYRYPILWMEDLPSSFETGLESFTFRVVFVTQLEQLRNREDDPIEVNANDVKSDMKLIGVDYLSYWKQVQSTLYPSELRFDINTTWNWLEDATSDRLYGGYLEVSFKIAQKYNKCIIPMNGITPPAAEVATIYINGDLFTTVSCNGSADIPVKDTDGTVVGSKVGTEWIVPAAGAAGSFTYDILLNTVDTGQDLTVDGTDITINLGDY